MPEDISTCMDLSNMMPPISSGEIKAILSLSYLKICINCNLQEDKTICIGVPSITILVCHFHFVYKIEIIYT